MKRYQVAYKNRIGSNRIGWFQAATEDTAKNMAVVLFGAVNPKVLRAI